MNKTELLLEYEWWIWPDDKQSLASPEKKAAYLAAKEQSHKDWEAWSDRHPFVEKYANFGFVAGCFWGDDSSWKIQFLDLREADKGIVKRDDRFGYLELPHGAKLKDVIDAEEIEDEGDWASYESN